MTTEIKFNPSLSAAVATQGTAAGEQQGVQQEKQVAPLLGGENVKVSSAAMTDLEKLVARLKSEDDETRASVTQLRLAAVMSALETANVTLTQAQAVAFADMTEQQATQTALENELAEIYATYGIGPNDSASAVMEAKIKSLEQALERAIQEGKDHNETVEKEKEKLERELAKARADAARIPVIQTGIAATSAKITADMAILGPGKLNEIAVALTRVADGAEMVDERESEADRQKAEEKAIANDPRKAIFEALDKIDEAILQAIDENLQLKA